MQIRTLLLPLSFLVLAACTGNEATQPAAKSPALPAGQSPAPLFAVAATEAAVVGAPDTAAQEETAPARTAGDFNGDGRSESMWLELPPGLNTEELSCGDGTCTATIRFSDAGIPPIPVKQCIGGLPVNLGDLNGDGSDEIGLSPEWFTSCWAAYYVWRLRDGAWGLAVRPFSTHCVQFEEDTVPVVRRDPEQEAHVIIRYSENTGDDIKIRSRSVALQ